MDKLPLEILLNIFKFIPYQNYYYLRLVSKKWNKSIDYIKIEELNLKSNDYYYYNNSHYLNSFYTFKMDEDLFLSNNLILSKFKNIKKLKTYLLFSIITISEFYNKFTELEHLEIKNLISNDLILNLKKLKYLKIKSIGRLQLNLPELIHLNSYSFDRVDIKFPEKLKILRLDYIKNEDISRLFNTKFSNLEYLELQGVENDQLITANKLNKLENLKLFKINNNYNHLNPIRLNIIPDKLKIFINGLEFDHYNRFINDNNSSSIDHILDYAVKNYNEINNCELSSINYNKLINLFNCKLPDNFYDKFGNIKWVKINSEIKNEFDLLEFLNKLNIVRLEFDNILLSKLFFDNLKTNNIEYIEFKLIDDLNLLDNNFNHIFNLKCFFFIQISKKYSLDFILKMVNLKSELQFLLSGGLIVYLPYNYVNYNYNYNYSFDLRAKDFKIKYNSITQLIRESIHRLRFNILESRITFNQRFDFLNYLNEIDQQFKKKKINREKITDFELKTIILYTNEIELFNYVNKIMIYKLFRVKILYLDYQLINLIYQ